MAIRELELVFDEKPHSQAIADWLKASRARIELYWDNFKEKPLPQYIECDFDYVASALCACVEGRFID